MKKYVILMITLFFISCHSSKEAGRKIESIKVWYYNIIFEETDMIGCNEIVYLPEKVDTLDVILENGRYLPKEPVILESLITDKEVLKEIFFELQKRKATKRDYMDARMKCYISYSDGQTDSLCIGNKLIIAPTYVSNISSYGNYNGKPVELTNKLFYLLRENCGFYRWLWPINLKHFDELNDTTFVRKKVKSRYGGEY